MMLIWDDTGTVSTSTPYPRSHFRRDMLDLVFFFKEVLITYKYFMLVWDDTGTRGAGFFLSGGGSGD